MEIINITKEILNFPICLGYQQDHNATKLVFDFLTGNDNYLKLQNVSSLNYEIIPLENNEWVITSTYTQEPCTYRAQLMKKQNDIFIQNSQLFELHVKKSIGGNIIDTEVVPPNFQTKYDEMVSVTDKVKQDLASGKFNGLSAYELALKNGFVGTEQEWLASLDYEHSQEFTDLANQVKTDSQQVSSDKAHIDTTVANFNTDFTSKLNTFNQNYTDKTKLFNDNVSNANTNFDTKVQQASTNLANKETQINNDLDLKITQANTTIDNKVQQASDSATQAQASANSVKASENQITQNKDDILKLAIKPIAEGNPCMINDSTDYDLVDLKVYGKSTQNGVPTPQAPIEIVSDVVSEIVVSDKTGVKQTVKLTQPITLRGLKSEQGNITIDGVKYISDVICEKDGVVGVERNVLKYKLNTNNYVQYEQDNRIGSSLLNGKCIKSDELCAFFRNNRSQINDNVFWYAPDIGWLSIRSTIFNSVDDYKNFITTNDVYVYFGLKEPTFEPLPQADQEAIKKLKSYYPTTIINTNAFTQAQYVADTKMYIDNSIAKYHAQAQAQQVALMSLLPDETQATMIEKDQNNLLGGI